jgi:L-malate glycosyltransferase
MNVLHLDEQRGWRGGEQQASWLIQGTVAKGHRVWIAGKENGEFLRNEHGGVDIERIPAPFWNEVDPGTIWKLAMLCLNVDIDIIHAHSSHAHMIACLVRLLARRPSVVVSRRVSFPPRQDPINRWKYNAPDRIFAVSEKVAEVLRDCGIPEQKVVRVYSSIDFKRLEVPPADRSEFGISEDTTLLFNAGALVDHKDQDTLLQTMAQLCQVYENLHLLVAGEGKLREALEAQITALGLESQVTLAGHRDDVPAWMQAADCYISSSWSEGLGTSVLEALACETPVVATEAGGVGEMVLTGKTGCLVPNRDPEALAAGVETCLDNPEDAARMALAGRKRVESRFTTEGMVEATLSQYHALVAERLGMES